MPSNTRTSNMSYMKTVQQLLKSKSINTDRLKLHTYLKNTKHTSKSNCVHTIKSNRVSFHIRVLCNTKNNKYTQHYDTLINFFDQLIFFWGGRRGKNSSFQFSTNLWPLEWLFFEAQTLYGWYFFKVWTFTLNMVLLLFSFFGGFYRKQTGYKWVAMEVDGKLGSN